MDVAEEYEQLAALRAAADRLHNVIVQFCVMAKEEGVVETKMLLDAAEAYREVRGDAP